MGFLFLGSMLASKFLPSFSDAWLPTEKHVKYFIVYFINIESVHVSLLSEFSSIVLITM